MENKNFIAGNLIKTVVFVLFAAAVLVGNFFLESRFVSGQVVEEDRFNVFDHEKENIIPGNAVIRFDKDYAAAQTKVFSQTNPYIFEIEEGHLWGNFSLSNAKVNILVENLVIIPNGAVFDLKFDKSFLDLAVYDGDVYLGFLPEDLKLNQYVDGYSSLFMNRLLVPKDNRVTVSIKKITDKIKPLLYLKLAKEFKYASVSADEINSEWTKSNLKKDQEFAVNVKKTFKSEIFDEAISLEDRNAFADFILWAEKNLTFVPEKKSDILLDHLFSDLDKAVYSSFAADGGTAKAQEFLSSFELGMSLLPPEILASDDFKVRFDKFISDLSIFSSSDATYTVLSALLDKKIAQLEDSYETLNLIWLNVYKSLKDNDFATERALDNYYAFFDKLLGKEADEDFYRMFITYQNQLFDNLLFRYQLFYKDGYFAIKDVFENELLKIYKKADLNELKQDFISKKIDFMRRLKKFFFEDKVDILQTKKIYSRLYGEINKLMPEDSSAVAVIKLFESELGDFADFWGYLVNSDYHKSAYGPTHAERYEAYLTDRETIFSFVNVQEEILGDKVARDVDVVDVVNQIEALLQENEELGELELGEIKNVDQRYVDIKAVLGGYPFKAAYDRDTGLLNEVYAYEELISDRAIKLENLLPVLQAKFADVAGDIPGSDGEEYTLETDAQRTARFFIAKKVSEYGFIAKIENISVVDQLNAVYRVSGVTLDGFQNIEISFDIVMNGEIVTNLFMKVEDKPNLVTGKFTLEELVEVVKAEADLILNPPMDDEEAVDSKPGKVQR